MADPVPTSPGHPGPDLLRAPAFGHARGCPPVPGADSSWGLPSSGETDNEPKSQEITKDEVPLGERKVCWVCGEGDHIVTSQEVREGDVREKM